MGCTQGSGATTGPGDRGRRRGLRAGASVLAALLALLAISSPGSAQVVDPGTVIQTIDASQWNPPAPDTAGITYRPDTGELLTCDSEVDEVELYAGVNLWTHSRTGVVSGTATTLPWSHEPTGITWDPAGGRLWISDDDQKRIFEIDFGPDAVWNTADDVRTALRGYDLVNCDDLEDLTYNNFDGHLYIASSQVQEVCEVDPGPNGVFDGAATFGDDVVTTFSLVPFGILEVEGIIYDPFSNTLVLADRDTRDLYEVTPEGGYLRKIDVNFPGGTKPSGVTIAPGSTNPLLRNYWVTDRRVDNNGNPTENDGRIYEVVAIPVGGNGPPIVDAGPPQTIQWPANSANLSGFVSDDGHPYPPSLVLSLWSKQSGPGSVSFGSASSPGTTATFSAPGSYVLQLEGDDSLDQTVDTVAIEVSPIVTLTATTVGPGSVTLAPPGGTYTFGQTVTVSAVPAPDSVFTGFAGDLTGTATPQTLVMDADRAVTASFAALFDVSVGSSGPGSVTLDPPGGTYAAGTVVTVTATPDANAVFDGFAGDLTGSASPQLLTVDADKTISASFTQHYTLSLTSMGPGSVTLDPPAGPYAPGSSVLVSAIPDPDSVFTGFAGDLTGTTSPQTLVMDADQSVSAGFATLHDVAVSASGPGAVTLSPPGGTYAAGTVVTVSATPDANAVFDGFAGDLTGSASPQLLTVDADKTISASFTQLYTLSVATTGPGSVTLSPPDGSYAAGTLVTLIAVPGANAAFSSWGGALTGSANPETITVDSDASVSATFTQLFTVAIAATGPGSVTLDPPVGPYPAGSTLLVTATPDPDAAFLAWSGDLSGSISPTSLLVDGNKSVTGAFARLYDVTVQSTGPGSVTLDPPGGTYAAGTVVTVTATPDANAVFDGFAGDLTGTTSPEFLTVDADKNVSASFTLPAYTLTVTVQGSGSVTIAPQLGPYPAGSTVTLTAVPASSKWLFGGWEGDAAGDQNPLLLLMDGSKTVRAVFTSAGGGTSCGIGPELAALVPVLGWLYRRRRPS